MTSRHTGTVRGHGLSARSYAGVRSDYPLPGDKDREPAAQPELREILAPVHDLIARQHPALVAAFKAIPVGSTGLAALRAVDAWKREHHAAIQEARKWPE